MGTNFYWTRPLLNTTLVKTYGVHIGKRSAAGWYCWDCGLTLCKGGEAMLHRSRTDEWHTACPRCGQKPPVDNIPTAAKLELFGASQIRLNRPTAVHSCSSFSWAQEPREVRIQLEKNKDRICIQDEYGRTMTGQQFLDMLHLYCPVEFTDSVGQEFS